MDNTTLAHWGIKGMKWGVRRFQNKDGSLTPAGKKRYADETDSRDDETPEQRKERILKSHSAKDIYKNKDLFTDKEIQDAYNRLNNERNIKSLIPDEVSKGRQIIDKYVDTTKTIKSIVDSSSDLYNSYVKGKDLLDKIFNKK